MYLFICFSCFLDINCNKWGPVKLVGEGFLPPSLLISYMTQWGLEGEIPYPSTVLNLVQLLMNLKSPAGPAKPDVAIRMFCHHCWAWLWQADVHSDWAWHGCWFLLLPWPSPTWLLSSSIAAAEDSMAAGATAAFSPATGPNYQSPPPLTLGPGPE